MKNLKRVLSLALASVMVIGMMVVGTGAAFDDADKIQNKEAVDVMVALGVISGKGDGSNFDPNGTLTRAEAAKIITYMLIGGDKAEKLGTTGISFTDVPANYWAASYIGYCSNMGILAGKGDGTFGPTDELTGLAFGKMLLVALGYDAKVEKYVGNEWSVNVAVDMVEAGLALGDDAVLADPISRDNACLLAFKALTATMVEYKTAGTTITSGDLTITTGGSTATKVETDKTNYSDEESNKTLQFCEKYFEDLQKKTKDEYAKDAFGRPGYTWCFNDTDVDDIFVAEKAVKTYTTSVSPRTVYNDLGLKKNTDAKWFIDGFQDDAGTKLTLTKAESKKSIGGNGVVTEVYKVDGKYTVVQIASYMAKVTKVTEYKAATEKKDEVKATIDLEVYGTDYDTLKVTDYEAEGFKKNAYVVVTLVNEHDGDKISVESVEAADSFSGVMEKYTDTTVTVEGEKATLGQKYAGPAATTIGFKDTYTYYTDANGIVLYAKKTASAVSTDYLYVEQIQAKSADADLLDGASKVVKAKVVFTDGTHEVVDLKITKDGDDYFYQKPATDGTVAKTELADLSKCDIDNWFAYDKNSDGSYTLTAVDGDYAVVVSGQKITAEKATVIGSKYTNTNTVVTAIDDDYKVTSFTGYPNAEKSLTGKVLVTYAKDSKVIANIFAFDNTVTVVDKDYAYAVKAGAATEDGTEWIFAVNGEQVTYVIEKGTTAPVKGNVYNLSASETTEGTYTVGSAVAVSAAKKVVLVEADYIVTDSVIELDDDCQIFDVNSELESDEIGLAGEVEEDDYVSVIIEDGKAVVIYITVKGE